MLATNSRSPVSGRSVLSAILVCILVSGAASPGGGAPAAASVDAAVDVTVDVLVPRGAVWRYLDDGSDQGFAWHGLGFDDSAWASGPAQLGYGDGDEATAVSSGGSLGAGHITTYFRHTFEVADPTTLSGVTLSLLRDDGAVAYLNEVEVARSNMPTGAVDHRTLASLGVADTEEAGFHSFSVDPALFLQGTNVLAVEIHQWNIFSSDASFDLELSGAGPAVVRGPYLQRGTPTGAVLRWRTDQPTGSTVWLGPSPDALDVIWASAVPTTEHKAEVVGLSPDTEYFYGVGSGNVCLAGGDEDHRFTTSPPFGDSKPTRVWVIGDSGTATEWAAAVRDAYLGFTGARGADVWLMLGDNAYESGTDAEYQVAMFDMYQKLLRSTFVYSVLGNHDRLSADENTQTGVYFDIFDLPDGQGGGVSSGTEAYYAFDHGDIHFIALNPYEADLSPNGAMLRWLQADLDTTEANWIIAYWHDSPYTGLRLDLPGEGAAMRKNALPILEAGGVDLVLTAHSHVYERSFLLNGYYGTLETLTPAMKLDRGDGRELGDGVYTKPTAGMAANQGTIYVVAGSAGSTVTVLPDHPAMSVSLNSLGSVVVDIAGNRLDAIFLDGTGQVKDSFTLLKGVERTLRRDEPRISIARGGRQGFFLDAGAQYAGMFYQVAGSFGTYPGFRFGSLHVPLNWDAWFVLSLAASNSSVYQNTAGVLDINGTAQAGIAVPPLNDPRLVGLVLHHAYSVFDTTQFFMVSNAVKLTLTR